MLSPVVLSTEIEGVPKFISGKVRDVFDLQDSLLMVTSDRISAFDVVLPTGIPQKGRVLTQISLFWFEQLADVTKNHLISSDIKVIAESLKTAGATNLSEELLKDLDGRSLLVRKCNAFPIECVVRGYIAGSAWKDYQLMFSHGGEVNLYGHPVRIGMRESDQFDSPLFTPATKATSGHDENISGARAREIVGNDAFDRLQAKSKAIYSHAAAYAAARGIIIADTKFEFGTTDQGDIILIDEALTPDSSRFWDGSTFKPGKSQPSFDKQFVRDYLETLDWDKSYPGPELPPEIVERTAEKYVDAFRLLTGKELTI